MAAAKEKEESPLFETKRKTYKENFVLFGVDERGVWCGAVATFPFAGSKGDNGRNMVEIWLI